LRNQKTHQKESGNKNYKFLQKIASGYDFDDNQ